MSIRIYNDGLAGTGTSATGRSQELSHSNGTAGSSSRVNSGEDQVQLSSLSESLSAHQSARAARVQNLASLYQSGNYQVNATHVAQSMVNSALGGAGLGTP